VRQFGIRKFAGWTHHPLLQGIIENDSYSPVSRMTLEDRLVADYQATGFTLVNIRWAISGKNSSKWESRPAWN
jgi:hypothetical protein